MEETGCEVLEVARRYEEGLVGYQALVVWLERTGARDRNGDLLAVRVREAGGRTSAVMRMWGRVLRGVGFHRKKGKAKIAVSRGGTTLMANTWTDARVKPEWLRSLQDTPDSPSDLSLVGPDSETDWEVDVMVDWEAEDGHCLIRLWVPSEAERKAATLAVLRGLDGP